MVSINEDLLFNEKLEKMLKENAETLQGINRALGIVEEIKKKNETQFKKLSIAIQDLDETGFLDEDLYFAEIRKELIGLFEMKNDNIENQLQRLRKILEILD